MWMKPRRRWHSCALWLVLGAMLAGSCRPDRDGSGENSSTPGSGSGDESTQPGSVYTAQELDQEPRVINQTDIFGLMAQIHPTLHLDPGTRAEVIARFAVRPDGMVDTASIVVVGSTAPKL